jgi:hypothetical protein
MQITRKVVTRIESATDVSGLGRAECHANPVSQQTWSPPAKRREQEFFAQQESEAIFGSQMVMRSDLVNCGCD